ncbi:MAG TPA: hypothetical protein VIK26_06865 [Clostridium sp.]|jgi:hypothetical protein
MAEIVKIVENPRPLTSEEKETIKNIKKNWENHGATVVIIASHALRVFL